MDSHAHARYERMPFFLWGYTALLLVAGLLLGPLSQLPAGLSKIILTETALITDYVLVAGPGPALVNAALVTAISILILHFARVPYNGITLVVIGLMSGFSLFGKNFLNIWPILLGAWLYAKSRHEPFSKYAPTGLMATALSGRQLLRTRQRLGYPADRHPRRYDDRLYPARPVGLHL